MIRRQFDPHYHGHTGELNNEPSKTVPDQTLTIRQLLNNHARGIKSDVREYQGEYFEDQEIPIVDDINDLAEMRTDLKNRQIDIEDQIKAMEDAKEIELPQPPLPPQNPTKSPPSPPEPPTNS